jgi:hypothetical protein
MVYCSRKPAKSPDWREIAESLVEVAGRWKRALACYRRLSESNVSD